MRSAYIMLAQWIYGPVLACPLMSRDSCEG
jgi:hypothetical protein